MTDPNQQQQQQPADNTNGIDTALFESLLFGLDGSSAGGEDVWMAEQERALLVDFGVPDSQLTSTPNTASSSTAQPQAAAAAVAAVASPTQQHHLVSQFTALAERLGIALPEGVLSSIGQQQQQQATGQVNVGVANTTMPQMPQFQAAAAANDNNRKRAASNPSPASDNNNNKPPVASAAAASSSSSRRKKKPRLSDCETKLATLKAENEVLKRHVDIVLRKSQKFDQERKGAEDEMKTLLKQGAGPEQLNPVVHKFGEMYSDYGRHRHEELTFHLRQLERLAAPTNFTKMGLWTLGQSTEFYTDLKRNPIAGILRTELGITPQQGRKILEHRQRIQSLSSNLRECMGLLDKLKALCEQKNKIFHDRMSKCQEILSPIQVVKLLLWVDNHCNILESVCPGWGSERIQSIKPDGSNGETLPPPP